MENIRMLWVSINKVIPNPKNPRGNISVKTTEMQQIILNKSWETGITCYEKNSKYIILSGHRRWYAAKKLKLKELPVILVEAPKSDEEELKRLGSVQGGKEDWTDFEWAKHTYEMWIKWEKCSFEELSKKMRRSSRWVAERIKVFQYYPHNEIETGLINGSLNIKTLYGLIGWLEKLSTQKSKLVDSFTIQMIRSAMLQKIEARLIRNADLKNERFIRESSDEQMKDFLLNNKMKLSDCLIKEEIGISLKEKKESLSFQQKLISISESINKLDLTTLSNIQETINHINEIKNVLLKKQTELKTLL